MDTLNTQKNPDYTLDPAPLGPLSGNRSDDDGLVIDETFEAPMQGPQEYGGKPYESEEIKPQPTRMLSKTYLFSTVDGIAQPDPIQAFPADIKRKEMIIRVRQNGDPTYRLALASDKSDCYSGASIMPVVNVPVVEWRSSEHTGAIWLYFSSTTPAASINVDIWVVTE